MLSLNGHRDTTILDWVAPGLKISVSEVWGGGLKNATPTVSTLLYWVYPYSRSPVSEECVGAEESMQTLP